MKGIKIPNWTIIDHRKNLMQIISKIITCAYRPLPEEMIIERYQKECRFYLDEYPKQDKIRKRFFCDYILNKLKKENHSTFAKENKIEITYNKLYDTIQKLKNNYRDIYFERRWLRRN